MFITTSIMTTGRCFVIVVSTKKIEITIFIYMTRFSVCPKIFDFQTGT